MMVMLIHRITEDAGTLAVDTCLVDSFPDSSESERLKAIEMAANARRHIVGGPDFGEITGGRRTRR